MRSGEMTQGRPRHVLSFDVEGHFKDRESIRTQLCKERALFLAGSKLWK